MNRSWRVWVWVGCRGCLICIVAGGGHDLAVAAREAMLFLFRWLNCKEEVEACGFGHGKIMVVVYDDFYF